MLNMFRMLIHPSSGACDLCVELLSYVTHEITQHTSRKFLRMDVLTSETCWALCKEIIKQGTSSWSLFTQLVRTAFIWTIRQRVVVIPYRRFGANYRSYLQGHAGPEMSVRNCHYSLRNSSQERSCHLFRSGGLNPHKYAVVRCRGCGLAKSLRLTGSMKHMVTCYSSSLALLFIPSRITKIPPKLFATFVFPSTSF